MTEPTLGKIVRSFFVDHLQVARGLRRATIHSYRDALRLFLNFVAGQARRRISDLQLEDLSYDRTLAFLRHLEVERGNGVRTRNQRLAALHVFFDYLAARVPEMLAVAERVARIPSKRIGPPETCFLSRQEVQDILDHCDRSAKLGARDRALFLFLYNTGARAQEVANLRAGHIDWDMPRVRLHGKGGKWRACPLWKDTVRQLRDLLGSPPYGPEQPVFISQRGGPLERYGIYKRVRKYAAHLDRVHAQPESRRITPHVFRHTTAVHLLEAGVEVNVIGAWLGHVSLQTTNRYAEITARAKQAALRAVEPEGLADTTPSWQGEEDLLAWLEAL